jgi:hypothetical protein
LLNFIALEMKYDPKNKFSGQLYFDQNVLWWAEFIKMWKAEELLKQQLKLFKMGVDKQERLPEWLQSS